MSPVAFKARLAVNPGAGGGGSGPDGTQNYVTVTIASSQVASTLTDFPVYVDLSDLPVAFFTNVQSDGGDIRVTESDGTTRAPVDLVSIDTGASTGELHFLASSLSSSSDTVFRIYYNASTTQSQPGVATTYGRNAVWSGYEGVWHLDEDPTGGTDAMVDSTGNGNDGTANGSMTSGDSVAGKLAGNAIDLDGTDDFISLPNHAWGTEVVVEGWVNAAAQDGKTVFSETSTSSDTPIFMVTSGNTGQGQSTSNLRAYHRDNIGTSWSDGLESTAAAFDSTWHHFAFTRDGTATAFYVDGSAAGSETQQSTSTTSLTTASIGALDRTSTSGFLQGRVDELRTRTVLPAGYADVVAAIHTNQDTPTTFYTVGTEQTA